MQSAMGRCEDSSETPDPLGGHARSLSCGLASIAFAFAQVPTSATLKTVLNRWPGDAFEQSKQPETVVGSAGNWRIIYPTLQKKTLQPSIIPSGKSVTSLTH